MLVQRNILQWLAIHNDSLEKSVLPPRSTPGPIGGPVLPLEPPGPIVVPPKPEVRRNLLMGQPLAQYQKNLSR